MSDDSADLHAVVAAAIAPLAARIDHLFAIQQEHIQSLAQTTARLDELAQQVTDLRGQAIWFEHRAEGAESYARNARNIAMQAEHQMRQEVASVNERLLDVTADLHRLHSIRESPEHELYRLHSELAVLQRRLTQIEGAGTSQ
jgi:chromosome segregation ATPase